MSDTAAVERFLACRRLAFVGVSRNPKDFSRALFHDLLARGYDVVPVNPCATEVEGRRCYSAVGDVAPPVEAAFLMTSPAQSAVVVRDCLGAGVRKIWFHQGLGQGALSPAALQLCREGGAEVVAGECPYMYLSPVGLAHRIHGFFRGLRPGRKAAA